MEAFQDKRLTENAFHIFIAVLGSWINDPLPLLKELKVPEVSPPQVPLSHIRLSK